MSDQLLLTGIKAEQFQHPKDKQTLNILEKIPALNSVLTLVLKKTSESMMKFVKAGSCIEITEQQYPSVYKIFVSCCHVLDIPNVPKLYIDGQRSINASVDGIEEPVVFISEGAIEALDEEELKFLFGYALGDVKANHLLYHKVVSLLQSGFAELLGNLALPIKEALLAWYRASLFSSDRAGLLCCQSKTVAISCLAKMAGFIRTYKEGFSVDAFIEQAMQFKKDSGNFIDSFFKETHYVSNESTAPLTVLRVAELLEWIESGEYEKLMNRGYTQIPTVFKTCPRCGKQTPANSNFCPNCGSSQ